MKVQSQGQWEKFDVFFLAPFRALSLFLLSIGELIHGSGAVIRLIFCETGGYRLAVVFLLCFV